MSSSLYALRTQKQCSCCKQWKHISEFSKNKRRPDGLQNNCKPCRNRMTRSWRRRTRA